MPGEDSRENQLNCTPSQKMLASGTTAVLSLAAIVYLLFDCHQNPKDRYWKELCRHNDDYELTDIVAAIIFVLGVSSTLIFNKAYDEYNTEEITTPLSPGAFQKNSNFNYNNLGSNDTDNELPVKKDKTTNCCVMM